MCDGFACVPVLQFRSLIPCTLCVCVFALIWCACGVCVYACACALGCLLESSMIVAPCMRATPTVAGIHRSIPADLFCESSRASPECAPRARRAGRRWPGAGSPPERPRSCSQFRGRCDAASPPLQPPQAREARPRPPRLLLSWLSSSREGNSLQRRSLLRTNPWGPSPGDAQELELRAARRELNERN